MYNRVDAWCDTCHPRSRIYRHSPSLRRIDIVIVAILIYQFLLIIRGRRAVHVLLGLCVLGLIYAGAVWAKLELLHTILATLAPYTAIALIVMFQSELRRALARLGRRPFLGISQLERRELSQEVVLAVGRLSQTKVGALIVIERKIGLRTFIESGVSLDALVSRDLLCSIFHPGGTLHDGAVIIQGDRISAAACFLPLDHQSFAGHRTRHPSSRGARNQRGIGLHRDRGLGRDRQGIRRDIWRNRDRCSAGARGTFALRAPGPRREAIAGIARAHGPSASASVHVWIVHESMLPSGDQRERFR